MACNHVTTFVTSEQIPTGYIKDSYINHFQPCNHVTTLFMGVREMRSVEVGGLVFTQSRFVGVAERWLQWLRGYVVEIKRKFAFSGWLQAGYIFQPGYTIHPDGPHLAEIDQ